MRACITENGEFAHFRYSPCRLARWSHPQVPLADVVAFGDGDNDAEFLAAAGLGVAMLNGTAMAKQNAVCVSAKDHDEDGVAVELERIFAETLQSGAV